MLHIISDTNIGGAGSYLLNFLEYFDRSLLNVRVACPPGSLLAAKCAEKGVPVTETAALSPDESFQWRGLTGRIRELVYIIRKYRVRVVHTHASFTGRLAAKIAGVGCIVYTKHRLDDEMPAKGAKGRIFNLVNHLTCHRVIAVSEAVKEKLIRQGVAPEKITVIYNGVDVEGLRKRAAEPLAGGLLKSLRPPGGQAARLVGAVARLEPEKGHQYLLEAARLVLDAGINARFVIAGTGSLAGELKSTACRLGIEEAVIFTGFVENVPQLLAALDVVVLPSLTESFGLALVEGMCLGKPCVGSNVGGIREIITPGVNGLLAEPGDAAALAEKISFLLQNPENARRMGSEAARTVEEKFDARLMTKRITDLYYRCASR